MNSFQKSSFYSKKFAFNDQLILLSIFRSTRDFTMKNLLLFIGLFCSLTISAQGDLVQLCYLINYYESPYQFFLFGVDCLKYNDYGCWCGFGGNGKPVDGVDECCKLHDECYGRIQPKCNPYLTSYNTKNGKCGK